LLGFYRKQEGKEGKKSDLYSPYFELFGEEMEEKGGRTIKVLPFLSSLVQFSLRVSKLEGIGFMRVKYFPRFSFNPSQISISISKQEQ